MTIWVILVVTGQDATSLGEFQIVADASAASASVVDDVGFDGPCGVVGGVVVGGVVVDDGPVGVVPPPGSRLLSTHAVEAATAKSSGTRASGRNVVIVQVSLC